MRRQEGKEPLMKCRRGAARGQMMLACAPQRRSLNGCFAPCAKFLQPLPLAWVARLLKEIWKGYLGGFWGFLGGFGVLFSKSINRGGGGIGLLGGLCKGVGFSMGFFLLGEGFGFF